VVAGHGEHRARRHAGHGEPQHVDHARAAVDEVADEHHAPARGVPPHRVAARRAGPGRVWGVAELGEQRLELVAAAVYVADHVERPRLVAPVGRERHAHDLGGVDVGGRAEHVHHPHALVQQPLAARPAERAVELGPLPHDDLGGRVAVGARLPPRLAHGGREVEHHGAHRQVRPPGEGEQRRPRVGAHVGRVDHGEPRPLEAQPGHEVHHAERGGRGRLVVLAVAHHRPRRVGRHDLRRPEVPARERALAAARRDRRGGRERVGDLEAHDAVAGHDPRRRRAWNRS
jgi:hypothetical protein